VNSSLLINLCIYISSIYIKNKQISKYANKQNKQINGQHQDGLERYKHRGGRSHTPTATSSSQHGYGCAQFDDM
jgi:hypothetical protein